MTLSAEAQRIIAQFPLGFVATVTAEGRPAVSPKGTFLVLDQGTLAFGEIRSPQTLANLSARPELEVCFADPFVRKGVRLRGPATVLSRGAPEFEALIPLWRAVWGGLSQRINRIVQIKVAAASPLSTPPYDTGATEEEMIALYKAKYAEIYP